MHSFTRLTQLKINTVLDHRRIVTPVPHFTQQLTKIFLLLRKFFHDALAETRGKMAEVTQASRMRSCGMVGAYAVRLLPTIPTLGKIEQERAISSRFVSMI